MELFFEILNYLFRYSSLMTDNFAEFFYQLLDFYISYLEKLNSVENEDEFKSLLYGENTLYCALIDYFQILFDSYLQILATVLFFFFFDLVFLVNILFQITSNNITLISKQNSKTVFRLNVGFVLMLQV